MAIPQPFLQELLARADIVEIVGRHVQLKKGGANFMGLCPFHGEKSPSFSVSPTKQFFHCFGCGKHGDAIGFLMEHTGMGFVEAVQDLAQQYGMQVPEDESSPEERARASAQRQRQATLSDVLEKAGEAYRKHLKGSPRAIDYLKGRGLTGEIARQFGLGYAPEGWRSLASVFADYDDALLVESGLVILNEEDGAEAKRYDRFRDRIMFPIRNVKGECIGFGGRVIGDGTPKYLNSPETPVFSKGRELYGLFEARNALRDAGYVLVTEGYMDVVALAQLGFANAVATLGTACTGEHVHKLFRFTDSVVFSFDGDAAGRRAARKALDAALPWATDLRSVKFLFLPAEHDPDSYIREFGTEAFAEEVKKATPLSRFLVEAASAECELDTAEGRARMASQARPLWSALPDGALKRQLLAELAQGVGMGANELLQMWQHTPGGRAPRRPAPDHAAPHADAGVPSDDGGAYYDPEGMGQAAPAQNPRRRYPPSGQAGRFGGKGYGGKGYGAWRRGEPPPPRMLGQRRAGGSRADRAVGLLLANSQAWDSLSAEDHAMLAHLPAPHGPVFVWLESQLHEHGPQPWAALREALRGSEFEAMACTEVEQATMGADTELELAELAGVMDLLRGDALNARAEALAQRVAQGDPSAFEEFKRVNEQIKALKSGQSV